MDHSRSRVVFAGQAAKAAAVAIFRPRAVAGQLHGAYVGALPLALATGAALGVVIWMHLHGVLERVGPGYAHLLPQYLSLAIVLELAPLAAGLIAAGRSGASLGSELGAMHLSEQVDALTAMGLSPMDYLVGPRVLACLLSLPALTVVIAALALGAAYSAEATQGAMTWREFSSSCLLELRLGDVVAALAKTLVFGFLIGVVGCYQGLNADGGATAIGRAATKGVVGSILAVVAADVVLVRIIQVMMY